MELWAINFSLKISLGTFEALRTLFLVWIDFFTNWQSLMINMSILSTLLFLSRAISWTLCELLIIDSRFKQCDQAELINIFMMLLIVAKRVSRFLKFGGNMDYRDMRHLGVWQIVMLISVWVSISVIAKLTVDLGDNWGLMAISVTILHPISQLVGLANSVLMVTMSSVASAKVVLVLMIAMSVVAASAIVLITRVSVMSARLLMGLRVNIFARLTLALLILA